MSDLVERYPDELRVNFDGGKPVSATINGVEFVPADRIEALESALEAAYREGWAAGDKAGYLNCERGYSCSEDRTVDQDWLESNARATLNRSHGDDNG